MGRPNIFQISFADVKGVFYSGSFVNGHVTIELTKPLKMRGVVLSLEGNGYVHDKGEDKSEEGKQRADINYYKQKEKYFENDILLFGIWSGQGSETSELPEGRHTFPFQFELPQGLPSSFDGEFGLVRYHAFCKIDRPWKFDIKTQHMFTVIGILDLNTNPDYSKPLSGDNQKHLCWLCCKSGLISAQFHIARQGWIPGETIKLYADINNRSSSVIRKSYVKLKMVTTFTGHGQTRKILKNLVCIKRPSIPAFGEDSWTGEELVIPPLPPSFMNGTEMIDVTYTLQLHIDPSAGNHLVVSLPIIIGTIPLITRQERVPVMESMFVEEDPSAPPSYSAYMQSVGSMSDEKQTAI